MKRNSKRDIRRRIRALILPTLTKGLLIVPKSLIPKNVSMADFAEQLKSPGSLVFIDGNTRDVQEINFYNSTLTALKRTKCMTMQDMKMIRMMHYEARRRLKRN